MIPRFTAINVKGKLSMTDADSFVQYLNTLPEAVIITVISAKEKQQRSSNQNRYFHGPLLNTLTLHFNNLGYTRKEVKEIVKYKFLSETVVIEHEDGETEEIEHIKPTSSLNTAEFEEFNRSIREWASTLGCDIKEPNED